MTSRDLQAMTAPAGATARPRLLDLFCGAGGCTKGFQEAGFYVVGVDRSPMPNYCGDEFVQADALEVLRLLLAGGEWNGYTLADFDAIHASPPCQASSDLRHRHPDVDYPELIPPTRELLLATGLPYVIENVEGAALIEPTMLCGSAFGLPLQRHRLFETGFPMMSPGCSHGGHRKRFRIYEHGEWFDSAFARVYGNGGGKAEEHWAEAMGIDWMTRPEMAQAIPPAFTRHIGAYLLSHIEATDQVAA